MAKTKEYQRVSVLLYPRVETELNLRIGTDGNRTGVLNKHLERYFAMLAESRRRLRQQFSDREIALLVDLFNGTLFADTFSISYLAAEVEDAEDEWSPKWGVDRDALLDKLHGLSYADSAALVDAIERWWDRVGQGETPQPTVAEVLGN